MSNAVTSRVLEIQKLTAPAEMSDRLTQHGSIAVAQFEPPFLELARFGRVFGYSGGVVANAVAPVTDAPTTAAAYYLYNGEATGGKCIVPLLITCRASSGTMGLGAAMMCCVAGTQATAPSNGTGVVGPAYLGGSTSVTTAAKLASGVTLDNAAAWIAVASVEQPAAVQLGAGIHFEPKGMFIIRPKCGLGITVLAPAGTTAKYTTDVIWAELSMDLV